MDGSQKLPQRLLGVVRDRRAAGAEPAHAVLAVAAWMRYVSAGRSDTGQPLPLDDPLADRLRSAADGAEGPQAVVDALLAVPEVFGTDLREDATVRRLLIQSLRTLTDQGAIAAATDLLDRAPA
jgi:fructuronate reductase